MFKKDTAPSGLMSCTTTFGDNKPNVSPFVSCSSEKMYSMIDAIDKLRCLNVTQEGIPLPTIVVVGDPSSGKSSVLESLAGISLPRPLGICSPFILRLKHHQDPVSEFVLEYENNSVKIMDENLIPEAIDKVALEIARKYRGISSHPITLVVKKKGVPSLTFISLRGISPVTVDDQVTDITMELMKSEENIILNVLSSNFDFPTCESIRQSRHVDNNAQRTLVVVTKSDQSPDGLLEKLTTNDINVGLGYVCVRNRINDETFDEARIQEAKLFKTHPLLSKIDKSMVGIPVLARKLAQIQSIVISKCLPEIFKKINERLGLLVSELNKLPQESTSLPDVIHVIGSLKDFFSKILIRGEFNEHDLDNNQIYHNVGLVEKLDMFLTELQTSVNFSDNFLVEEIQVLEETVGIRLPYFVSHSAFLSLVDRRLNSITDLYVSFANEMWNYLKSISDKVLIDQCGNSPSLLCSMRITVQNVMAKLKKKLVKRVAEVIKMEKITAYTCSPDFVHSWNRLKANHEHFSMEMCSNPVEIDFGEYGMINVEHLKAVPSDIRNEAFYLKMRMAAYWDIVSKRMVESLALELRYLMQEVVYKEIEMEIVNKVMVQSDSLVAKKKEALQKSISLLQESKLVIEQVMKGVIGTHD